MCVRRQSATATTGVVVDVDLLTQARTPTLTAEGESW